MPATCPIPEAREATYTMDYTPSTNTEIFMLVLEDEESDPRFTAEALSNLAGNFPVSDEDIENHRWGSCSCFGGS